MTYDDAKLNAEGVDELIGKGYVEEEDGLISIEFLDEQIAEVDQEREKKRAAGRKSAQARAKQKSSKSSTGVEQVLNRCSTEKRREEERREEEIDREERERKKRASALAPSEEFFESGDSEKPNTHTTDLAEKKEKVAPKRKKFVPPSIEEAEGLFLEVNMKAEAAKFIDYYEANGWKVGRNTMKDWKAAARNWARRHQEYTKSKPQTNGKPFDDLTPESFYETVREHVEQKQRDGVIGN